MQEGLLWYDNDPKRKLADKIKQASTRYRVRFSRRPTVCYLNDQDFDDKVDQLNGIQLRTKSNVLRHHLWIGVEDNKAS